MAKSGCDSRVRLDVSRETCAVGWILACASFVRVTRARQKKPRTPPRREDSCVWAFARFGLRECCVSACVSAAAGVGGIPWSVMREGRCAGEVRAGVARCGVAWRGAARARCGAVRRGVEKVGSNSHAPGLDGIWGAARAFIGLSRLKGASAAVAGPRAHDLRFLFGFGWPRCRLGLLGPF